MTEEKYGDSYGEKFRQYEDKIKELEHKLEQTEKDLADYQFNYPTIRELEKENAQWKQRNETLKDALEHARKLYGDELEKAYKENAELKKDNEGYEKDNTLLVSRFNQTSAKLTKAKEILKDITSSYGSTEVSEAQLYLKIKKAELFLNEVEK